MILVSFHGSDATASCITNVYAYSSATQTNLTYSALSSTASDAELRALVLQNGFLYVADGAKSASVVSYYSPVAGKAYQFENPNTFIAATVSSKGHFKTSISHPYALAFDTAGHAFVSNQDTNVLALVQVNSDGSGALNSGCQSAYLTRQFPKGVFLDGTFAGSQVGTLPHVDVAATPIPPSNGGLAISPTSGKVQHSIRDVVVNGQTLLVCDEASSCVRVYSLADGTYLNALMGLGSDLPTHLQILNGGLYASAGAALYWMPVPTSAGTSSVPFVSILSAPQGFKIAGLAFNPSGALLYVAMQASQGGAIYAYNLAQSSPNTAPSLTDQTVFMDSTIDQKFTDTPEFLLYQPDPA